MPYHNEETAQGKLIASCGFHHVSMTKKQIRQKGCLDKNGAWCPHIKPFWEHPFWVDRKKRRG